MDLLIGKIGSHISSTALVIALCVAYMVEGHSWIDDFLPINGKPLAIFTLLAVVVVHEIGIKWQKRNVTLYENLIQRTDDLSHQVEVGRLVQAVNGLYGRVIASDDDFIDNEYTIKELAELNDMRERLKVNSYTQGRLEYLNSIVKRF